MKRIIFTILSIIIAFGLSAQISIIGPATPAGNWETDFNMNQDAGNPALWSLRIQLTDDEIKFRQDKSWDDNWGGTAFPSGTAIPAGTNISVTPGGDYFVTFNTSTLAYNFELVNNGSSGITHQAVIRDAANQLVINQNIGVRISIIQYATTGPVVYAETHLPTSNVNGLITYVIGQGAAESGVFADIDWPDGPYFLKTEADPDGGSSYTISGISQFLSVPYALHAGSTSDKQWDENGTNIYNTNSGNVGIGEQNPAGKLHVSVPGEWLGVVFTGTGLNDLDVDISGYTGTGTTAYAVRIQNTGPDPNLIETSTDGGATWSAPIDIVPDIDMGNGVIINFGSTTGYTFSDRWDWAVNDSFGDVLVVSGDKLGVGTANPEAQLHTTGSVRFEGAGTPGEGKFLSSEADGTASWQHISSAMNCFDIDGNTYPTTIIGNQIWMAENLRVTKYRNGNTIPNITDVYAWAALTSGAYCWYDNDQSANAKYGALYNWYAVNDTRGLCPEGWRIPTDDDWTTLTNMLGGNVAGGKLKAVTTLWNDPNTDATNSSGFSALPGGYRNTVGTFSFIRFNGYWWSSTEFSFNRAWYRGMFDVHGHISRANNDKDIGFSVRCLKDLD